MEKKGNRSVQPVSKGLPSDPKKSQDGAGGGKPWPRGGRRREPASGSLAAKSEPCRSKPNSQCTNKSFEKRPRPRGAYDTTAATGRAETTGLGYEEQVEVGSIFSPGSKKQSLNHLLNFQYASHTPDERRYFHSGRFNNHNMYAHKIGLGKHKYKKEHFLNNNCQFVVNSSGDYRKYGLDPDALVEWDLIEQVNLQVSEYPSCPICLYPPVAAKMTRCGHIYCWSCMLHYLALSDKSSRNCPICEEYVHKQDLKSVVAVPHNNFNLKDTITFKLMKRLKGSLIAYPASATVKEDDSFFSLSEKEAGDCYSKLLLANRAEIMSIIEREFEELQLQLHESKDCPESCFIDEALTLLNERKTSVLAFDGEQAESQPDVELPLEDLEINDNNSCSNNEKDSDDSIASTNLETLDSKCNISPNSTGQHSSKFHYFYQAADGQHIYLHGVNARMLEHTYGSLEFGPQHLTGKILEKEEGLMTEQLRKKLRYLQHLPVTCPFEVAEIELKEPIITKETLQHFNEQIDGRRRKRQKRAQEEKRREKRITQEQNRQLGKYPIPDLHLESQYQFPSFEPSRTRTESEGTPSSEGGGSADDITPSSSLGLDNESSVPSFAKMLASKRETPKWPSLKPSGAADPAPVKLISVTGLNMRSRISSVRHHEDSEPETEDRILVPPCSVLSDVFGEALQRYERQESSSQAQLTKKKKKSKQKFVPLNAML